MTARHTPGPWQWITDTAPDDYSRLVAGDETVMSATGMHTEGWIGIDNTADALLIAAAPALLDALRSVEGVIDLINCGDPDCTDADPCVGRIVRMAIAAATGEQVSA